MASSNFETFVAIAVLCFITFVISHRLAQRAMQTSTETATDQEIDQVAIPDKFNQSENKENKPDADIDDMDTVSDPDSHTCTDPESQTDSDIASDAETDSDSDVYV